MTVRRRQLTAVVRGDEAEDERSQGRPVARTLTTLVPTRSVRLPLVSMRALVNAADALHAHPARPLVVLWALVALVLSGWGALAAPTGSWRLADAAGTVTVLEHRPAAPILSVWMRWDAPRGSDGWVVLEAGRPWPTAREQYWRRRVFPGWNQLVWDDLSDFPEGAAMRLRALDVRGPWSIAPATVGSTYGPAQLVSLRGLLAALLLAGGAAAWLLGRARVEPTAEPRAWWPALVLTTAVALGLRVHTLTTQSLWFDEVLTATGSQSLGWVLYSPQIFGHPPLQYLLGWASAGAQATEGWLRAPFVAAGTGSVVVVAYLGRRLLGAPTGLLAAGLLALSPFHIELSQLARPYAPLVLLAALSLLTLFRAFERGAAVEWVAFSAVTALALYTHYLAVVVLLVDALVAAAWVARRRGAGGTSALVSFTAVALLLAPWAPVLTRLAGAQLGEGQVSARGLGGLVTSVLIPQFLGAGLAGAVAGALALLGLWTLRRRPEVALAAIATLALPLAVTWLGNPRHFLAGRHFALMLPLLVIVLAHGVVSAIRAAESLLRPRLGPRAAWARRAITASVAFALLLAASAPASASLDQYYRWRRGADWRTVATVLDRLVRPGDQVVATLGAAYPLRYYWRGTVIEVDERALREGTARAPAGRHLWIVTLEGWDWQPTLHAWLATHAVQVGEIPPSWSLPGVSIHRTPPRP